MTLGPVSTEELQQMNRPDSKLPPELKNENIREIRDVSSTGQLAYQIVFDQSYLPYSYWNPKPDGWEMTYARVERHNDYTGILGWLLPKKACVTIVVTKEVDTDWLGDLR